MEDWFAEKHPQVDPSVVNAFGIELDSRHSQADEIIELIAFAQACARNKVAHYVKRAFYDSKANMCSLELDPAVREGDTVAEAILEAALETIGQFDWFGIVQHGKPLESLYSHSTAE